MAREGLWKLLSAALACAYALQLLQPRAQGSERPRERCAHTVHALNIEIAELRGRAARAERAGAALGGVERSVGAPAHAAGPPPPSGARQLWYWNDLVQDSLRPFSHLSGGITREGLRLAEQKCKSATYCHRAQVIGGRLYITDLRAIFFDRNYAMARVMPILETLRRWPVPDLDAVFQGTDYPLGELPRDAAHMERMYGSGQHIPPMFSPTATSVHLDIPWPDFAFFPPRGRDGIPHPLKTPRWVEAQPALLAQAREIRWEDKLPLAVFTGNMMGALRQRMYKDAERHPELMFVNEVFIKTSPPSCFEIGAPEPTKGGVLSKKCGLSFKELCRYKYLLNVGSNGYANKLRYLFLCGSVVIWVREGSLNHEFFERQFVPGVHYAPVDTVDEIPDAIRRMQADDAFARSLAEAGQARMAQMDLHEVTHYCYQMLKGYAKLQRFKPRRDPRSWEVNCEDDLVRHYARAVGRSTSGYSNLEQRYITEDNASCIRPPPAGARLGPPGWGGAYNGSKVPCLAAHDLSAKEEKGVCDASNPTRDADGPDWDRPEAYVGGSLPDWRERDPADTGIGPPVVPWRNVRTASVVVN